MVRDSVTEAELQHSPDPSLRTPPIRKISGQSIDQQVETNPEYAKEELK